MLRRSRTARHGPYADLRNWADLGINAPGNAMELKELVDRAARILGGMSTDADAAQAFGLMQLDLGEEALFMLEERMPGKFAWARDKFKEYEGYRKKDQEDDGKELVRRSAA